MVDRLKDRPDPRVLRATPASPVEPSAPPKPRPAPAGAPEPIKLAGAGYHAQTLRGTGPSSLVSVRVKDPAPEFASEGARTFAALVADAAAPSPGRVAAANTLLDAVFDHLDDASDRANRIGNYHQALADAPPDERVPLLRRAVHVLRLAARAGVLPSESLRDLGRLAKVSQGLGWNFDWDDNIANMDTKVLLFPKNGGAPKAVTTEEFAVIRDQIGKEGPFADYEVRSDDQASGSFQNFRDHQDPTVFWNDLESTMKRPDWKGPSWTAFQRAMASPETAKWSTIITARGHYPNTIHAALRRLRDRGLLAHVVPRENIFPVSLPGLADELGGAAESPSEAKVRVMEKYLDRLQAAPLGPSAQRVVPPDGGKERRYMHLWGFSDDDHGTFEKAVSALSEQVQAGRWPDVKVTVFFTGQTHPDVSPHAVVLTEDGGARPRMPSENQEVDRVLERMASYRRAQTGD